MIGNVFRKVKLMVALAMVGVLALTSLGVAAADSQQQGAQARGEVKGTVKAVDYTAGTVTILSENGTEVTVKVVRTTHVEIKGALLGVLGVSAGMEANARYDPATGEAVALKVSQKHRKREGEARVAGTISSVNASTAEITLKLNDGSTITLKTNSDTKIQVDGKAATLADLKVGARVKVEYNTDSKIVSVIKAGTEGDTRDEKGPAAEVHGTIQSVDTTQHKLVIKLRDGSTKELLLNSNTVIRIGGKVSSEADLKPGMQVEIRYRTDTNTALRINTLGKLESEAHGTVQSVDTANHKLVVELGRGTTLSLTLTADTVIRINGKQSAEGDLKAGMKVEVRYRADTNTALRINTNEKSKSGDRDRGKGSTTISGTLKAVDLVANTLTVTMQNGDLVLKITSSTKVLLNGADSNLATLATKLNANVTIEYNSRANVASRISVRA